MSMFLVVACTSALILSLVMSVNDWTYLIIATLQIPAIWGNWQNVKSERARSDTINKPAPSGAISAGDSGETT